MSPARDRALIGLRTAGAVALAAVPMVMALANRSSPVLVGVAAALFLASAIGERGRRAGTELLAPLRTPLGLAAIAFLAWCLLSLAWSPFLALSLRVLGEFAPTLAAAYLLVRLAPPRLPNWTALLAGLLLACACLFVVAALALDLEPLRALGQRAIAPYVLNRPVMTILLIAGPLALLLALKGRRVAGVALAALCALAVARSISGAAMLGLAAGAAMAVLAVMLPKRIGLAVAGAGLAAALALAPVEGDVLQRFMPDAAHARLVQSSSRARVAIAQSFGAVVAADPWRGAGYGTAARFAEVSAAQDLEPEMRRMLAVGHPHNSFLQVWAELGLVGAILAGLVLFLTLRALAVLPRVLFAVALGLTGTAATIAFVEHGAWQAWWTAGLGTAITWLRAAAVARPTRDREAG